MYCSVLTSGTAMFCCIRLDYCGISLLTIGSFVPWLYYSFYCRMSPKIGYLSLIALLGTFCIIVSMCDRFSTPAFRPLRAGQQPVSSIYAIECIYHCVTVILENTEMAWNLPVVRKSRRIVIGIILMGLTVSCYLPISGNVT